MEGRNSVFQRLKPACIALSEAALNFNGARGNAHTLRLELEHLLRVLQTVRQEVNALDVKLADYVFFPLSNALKASRNLPIQCLELALSCIDILIQDGWKEHIHANLACQLVILCTLLAEKNPTGLAFQSNTEDLMSNAFRCMLHIFSVLGSATDCRDALTAESNFPQLGQTVSVILDGIAEGPSRETQISAVMALQALMANIPDREFHAFVLPGVASKLTVCLTPQTKQRRDHRLLTCSLEVLILLLRSIMSDDGGPAAIRTTQTKGSGASMPHKSIATVDWQKSAAEQLKVALSNISRLKDHDRQDVQQALADLCLTILQHCSTVLHACCPVALETTMVVYAHFQDIQIRARLELTIYEKPKIVVMLQDITYNWLQSMATIVQGAVSREKTGRLQLIGIAYGLLQVSDTDMDTIDRVLATTLRDCIIAILGAKRREGSKLLLSGMSPIISSQAVMVNQSAHSAAFELPLASNQHDLVLLQSIEHLIVRIGPDRLCSAFVPELIKYTDDGWVESQVASIWLLLETVQHAVDDKTNFDSIIDLGLEIGAWHTDMLEQLYSKSLAILGDESSEAVSTQLKALALRTLALRAKTSGAEFRYELVDALYPILHVLATPDEQLQRDGMTALNLVASACEYSSAQELIVDNVDYLLNAVALKLNAFDVSPQAPQVLLMMLRLAGPRLLPYLEDTVESIFIALEEYHGYPLLVELLFRVLGVMVEEGVQTPQLAITDKQGEERERVNSLEEWQPTSISGLRRLIELNLEEDRQVNGDHVGKGESHPTKPWNEVRLASLEADDTEDEDEPTAANDRVDETELPPPGGKTYGLLLKITDLTQHFLPSASSSLRMSLLSLIQTVTPAIAQHENSFLPLINTLWPEIVARLDDDEMYVANTALKIISTLCEHAGSFIRTRIVQIWPRLVAIHARTIDDMMRLSKAERSTSLGNSNASAIANPFDSMILAVKKMEATPADYADTLTREIWSTLVDTLTTIAENVPLDADLFDELLLMLIPVLHKHRVRDVLERENADAVWLAELHLGAVSTP